MNIRIPPLFLALVGLLLSGCEREKILAKYELRWCPNGETSCVLKQSEGAYVKGGIFPSLDQCNDAVRHLTFYGNKLGGACVEISELDRENLRLGK